MTSFGKIVYTQFLNSLGGIEADVTVTRLSETRYMVVTPAATTVRDLSWMTRHRGDFAVSLFDATASEAVLCIMGPNARALLQAAAPWHDWSNEAPPFGTMHQIEIGLGLARAHRVSYVGELGWALNIATDQAAHVLEHLLQVGEAFDLTLCGLHAMDSCRLEKGFRHFGRDAVLRKKDSGLSSRMLQFRLTDPKPLLYHAEPILRDGAVGGYLTSGAYGHTPGGAVGLGYVPCAGEAMADLLASSYQIEIAGVRHTAEASLKPLYDATSAHTKV